MPTINHAAVRRFAEALRDLPEITPLDFYHTFDGKKHDAVMYPRLNHPMLADYFFLACLHQYGFWYGDDAGYREPMYSTIGGKRIKGSDAIWMSLTASFRKSPHRFLPERLASVTRETLMRDYFFCDDGPLPLPDIDARVELTRRYGCYLAGRKVSPARLVSNTERQEKPLTVFLACVSVLPGFAEDPLEKKQRLLAMALINRPEKLLRPTPGETLGPIVDYHLMRVALRLGLVELETRLRGPNIARARITGYDEHRIRSVVHDALIEAQRLSGISSEKLDFAMWSARRYCPEMETPNCAKCRFEPICAKRTELFQPVHRTTAY